MTFDGLLRVSLAAAELFLCHVLVNVIYSKEFVWRNTEC